MGTGPQSLSGRAVLFAAVGLCVVAACLFPYAAAHALTGPDTLEIEDARVFRHMLEPDDMLLVLRYNIHYGNATVQPYQPVDQTFTFEWTAGNGTSLGNATAYPMHNYGYGKGCVSFRLAAAEAPDWGDAGSVTVEGSDLFDDPPPSDTYNLTEDHYSPYSSPADIREDLRRYILASAHFLELDWNQYWVQLGATQQEIALVLDTLPYELLSPEGEEYFSQVIDNLESICPLLLSITTPPEYEQREHELALAERYRSTYEDTPVGEAQEGLEGLSGGLGFQTVGTIATMGIVLGVMVYTGWRWNRALVGLLAAFPAVPIMARMGFCHLEIMMGVVALCVIIQAVLWFFGRGYG